MSDTSVFRDFQPDDLSEIRRLHAAMNSEPGVDRAAHERADSVPGHPELMQRVVAVRGGQLLGYGSLARSAWHPPGSVQGEVWVAPWARRQGVGSGLAQRLEDAARRLGAASLTSWTDGQAPACEHFATRRGFVAVQRFVTMSLAVQQADAALLTHLIGRARDQGVRLFSYDETGDTPEARRSLYALNRRLAPLLPGNGPEFPTFEEYAGEVLDADWFRPEGQLVAALGERWVGLVGLGFYEGGRRLQHEFTAVDPACQRRGIALALKAWSVQKAREWGAQTIVTGNDATNSAIIALNRRLGYSLRPGVVKLRRPLEGHS